MCFPVFYDSAHNFFFNVQLFTIIEPNCEHFVHLMLVRVVNGRGYYYFTFRRVPLQPSFENVRKSLATAEWFKYQWQYQSPNLSIERVIVLCFNNIRGRSNIILNLGRGWGSCLLYKKCKW